MKKSVSTLVTGVAVAILVSACATPPLAPRVAVMPAPGKPFDVFVAEERACRRYAEDSVGVTPEDAATRTTVNTAAVATAIGAVAGAALGGRDGAAAGAAVGLVSGTAVGSGQGAMDSRDLQRRYDIAYQQCMYAKGNQLPGSVRAQPAPPYLPPPPTSAPPAPPAPPTQPPGR
jgi:hypothetical protein